MTKYRSKYYKTYYSLNTKHNFKRLHEARYMMQEFQQERSRKPVIPRYRRHLQRCPLLGGVAFTYTTDQRNGGKGVELLQQGFHLILHVYSGSHTMLLVYRLQHLVKAGDRIADMEVAEDARQHG